MVYNCIKSSKYMIKASIILDGFPNAHKIICIYYISEILADGSVKNAKKKLKVVKCTLRKKPTKNQGLYFYTYYMWDKCNSRMVLNTFSLIQKMYSVRFLEGNSIVMGIWRPFLQSPMGWDIVHDTILNQNLVCFSEARKQMKEKKIDKQKPICLWVSQIPNGKKSGKKNEVLPHLRRNPIWEAAI